MKTKQFVEIEQELPPGMKRDVLKVISQCKGRGNRISKSEIAALLHYDYKDATNNTVNRQMRLVINELRKEGYLILSDSGGAGYWMASEYQEVHDVVSELESRAKDMLEQSRILRNAAERMFSPQLGLM